MDKPSVVPFVPRTATGQAAGIAGNNRKNANQGSARKSNAQGRDSPRAWTTRWGAALSERRWLFVVLAAGFLLGRAVMLEGMSPFAAALFGVLLYTRRDLAVWGAAALIAGSFWSVSPMPEVICAEIAIVYLLFKGLELYEKADLSHAPVVVFSSVLLVRLFETMMASDSTWLAYTLTAVEAGLAFVLTLLFVHALPVVARGQPGRNVRHEEWVGLIILASCLITGMTGWSIYGVAVVAVLARYLVLAAALAGGPALGTSAGAAAGMIVSLSDLGAVADIGLLAFGGLMAGLIREGGKAAVAFGLLLGSSVLALYTGSTAETLTSTWATVAASALLFLTPRPALDAITKYVPGTPHYAYHQQEYAQKVRDLTAERVARFSEVFRQLSRSFRQVTQEGESARQDRDFEHFVETVHDSACVSCHRRAACWDKQFIATYRLMTDMMTAVEEHPGITAAQAPKSWGRHCVRTPQVLELLKREYELYRHDQHWRRQLQDSRYLVADQLSGVSQVMDDLVKEIRREGQAMERQEEEIRDAIARLGLAVHSIEIMSLEDGKVEIELVHAFRPGYDESRKIIAPLLSEILGETVTVRQERPGQPLPHLTSVTFASAKVFEVENGVAGTAKDGDLLSGDSFSMLELGTGKFAVALSDGMGNGARARMESSAALTMLEQLLQSGIDERLAVKSINSILLLRSPEEMFATIDLALIDLYSAQATLLKIGSTPSFIIRGREVIPVTANNLPVGILHDIEIDLVQIQLQPGDMLIMMTDGILDAPEHAVNKEQWMKRVLLDIASDDPQEMADALLDTALRQSQGHIRDDMTVIVTRISRYHPEWAAFRFPGFQRMERPRTVS